MILTIDEVKNTRFRMATRRSGYEANDVDVFVDKVEATLIELTEENTSLRRQVETLSEAAPAAEDQALREQLEAKDAELARLQEQVEASQGDSQADGAELERLREELQRKDAEIAAMSQGDDETTRLRGDLEAKDAELASLREQINHLRDAAANAPAGETEHLVVSTAADASPAVARLLQMATEQSERLMAEARAEAERHVGEAQQKSHEMLNDARNRADNIESDARQHAEQVTREADEAAERVTNEANATAERVTNEANATAERLTSEASARAAQVDQDASARRQELFSTLENERNKFVAQVDHLRGFEGRFRETFTAALQEHLDRLSSGSFEPEDVPELLSDAQRGMSATPRLDALLGREQDT